MIQKMLLRTVLILLSFALPLFPQTAENVLLVLNETSPISMDVGMYYAKKRGVPQDNMLRIRTPTDDTISFEDFDRLIQAPLAAWLTRNFAQDRILYIVLTKGIPLRITGTSGKDGTVSSVDSELTLLYRRLTGYSLSPAGPVKNSYYLAESPLAQAKRFRHADQDIYLVARLDGYNTADIRGLIDRGIAPSKNGRILLDAKGSSTEKADAWLLEAADLLGKTGFKNRVLLDTTKKILTGENEVLGYYSWGSNDPSIRIRHFDFQFAPGALAGMYVSTDARTFKESQEDWTIGESGFPQSLAADLIRDGVTGISGHVSEPFLEATIRPHILFPAYVSGFNLVESFYLAMPYLSWQTIVVGDPLCAPFRTKHLEPKDIDAGTDPDTELPVYFGTKRLNTVAAAANKQFGVLQDSVKLLLRAQSRLARQDLPGARQALEECISGDDRLPESNLLLASLYEASQEYDKAIGRYRRLRVLVPDNPIVLNNLAYALAVRKGNVSEALPLAEKAYGLAKNSPNIADTLGWIYHLAGQNDKAIKHLEEAARLASGNAEIHFHYAVASEAAGNRTEASAALQRAVQIDPKLAQREDVKQLQSKIKP